MLEINEPDHASRSFSLLTGFRYDLREQNLAPGATALGSVMNAYISSVFDYGKTGGTKLLI